MKRVTDRQYWMDGYLESNLNTITYNLQRDYDALIMVTGSGMVRVGKSVIAQQVGYYCAQKLGTKFDIDNVVFSGKTLMEAARKLPKNSVIIYDEARGELDNKKMMENVTKNLLDFFAECGMYNHMLIMVAPDFFEFPKSVAINRSEILLNVIRMTSDAKDKAGNEVVSFDRGVFEFYNRQGKKMLYIMGKKQYDDYGVGKKYRNFFGEFPKDFIVDHEEYDRKKLEHIQRERGSKHQDIRFGIALKALCNHISQREASKELKTLGVELTQARISQLISQVSHLEGK